MLPSIPLKRIDGSLENLQDYAGKALLIVNVASKCGFTSQYRDLQKLYEENKAKGLEILGFPCNQFGAQEPGSAEEIQNFCSTNYGVTFPMFEKVDVNGAATHPLYTFLKDQAPGILGTTGIKWNFTKFLVSKDGQSITRLASADGEGKMAEAIKTLL
ncbi:glutathione peroxidase [Polynucleobacter sp. AP-Melu-500A-A1]|uniref:glutathione peroxidase n=1 Tax=Polynucleobacter sp. AP-Melu-500A-A1 TaxID=2576929 RepID=UPI001C0E71CC|nr:glutathione peroxidase [Polynucleobacter sp. AP-Melu-500A-A1]MBU3630893.1 glutathione peroxidase [Polynucleobacter sp. AP-Melu-500A-A1]